MKSFWLVFLIIGYISLIAYFVIQDSDANKDWDRMVSIQKKIDSCKDGKLSPYLVSAPKQLSRAEPRVVLMGEEIKIEKLDKIEIMAGSGGFQVKYEGRSLGFCSYNYTGPIYFDKNQ